MTAFPREPTAEAEEELHRRGFDYSACLQSHWRKPARRHREDDPPGKIFGALIEEVRFAEDSPLEQAGFEPPVPWDNDARR
jgi:hypothetical protein